MCVSAQSWRSLNPSDHPSAVLLVSYKCPTGCSQGSFLAHLGSFPSEDSSWSLLESMGMDEWYGGDLGCL